ncbi:MAG: thiamine pyrophosphate-binding protein [Actinomycetota bacterium]
MASDGAATAARPTGGDLLVAALRSLGTDVAFGVVSVHNLPLVDAVDRDLRWVPTRGEAGAVNAADGWSRASGRIGCAVTSTGTGAGNAAGALVEALTAATPLLHITGQIDREHLGIGKGVIHETRDQLAMLQAISAWAATVGADAAADLAHAIAEASSHPRGPASLEWPIDSQFASPAPGDLGRFEPPDAVETAREPDGDLDRVVELIAAARRPLLWVGGGGLGRGPQLSELLDRMGAALITSNGGRGALAESDARVIGNFASSSDGAALLAEADLLLSIGTHFRSNETRSYGLQLPACTVQVDVDPGAIGRAYPASAGLVGSADVVLGALLDQLPQVTPDVGWLDRCTEVRARARSSLRTDIGPYAAIVDALNDVLGPASPRVRDITIPNSSWGNRLLEITDPRTNIYPRGGGIGQALGMALGASIARPDEPTLAIIGDGGLQVQLGELATIAQENVPITVVVFDDGGYGVLRNMQDQHLGRRSGVDLFTPSVPLLADAHGLRCRGVASAEQFGPAFADAVESREPSVIHVDCEQLGPMPRPFIPPVHIPESS